jgi:hypothetical protein
LLIFVRLRGGGRPTAVMNWLERDLFIASVLCLLFFSIIFDLKEVRDRERGGQPVSQSTAIERGDGG